MAIYEIGDLRHELKEDFIKNFNRLLDENGHRDKYHVLCVTTNLGNDFTTKMMLLNADLPEEFMEKASKVLGSQMYYVDNKEGRVDIKWCLPLDLPVTSTITQEDEICEFISQNVKDSNIKIVF